MVDSLIHSFHGSLRESRSARLICVSPERPRSARPMLLTLPCTGWTSPTLHGLSAALQGGLRAQHRGYLTGQEAAVAVAGRQLGTGHLPCAALAAQLLHRLDEQEHAVHAGVHAAQATAIGVHWQTA